MNRRFLSLLAGLLLFLSGSLFAQDRQTEIILLHTNDMHAKIDDMARLAYLADSLRSRNPFVFLVSAGDNFTGNPVVDRVSDRGAPMIDLMNHCGFQVSALGNHEFDMGQTFLKKRMEQAAFPFICCNADSREAEMGSVAPYTVLKAGDSISLAFLGILQLDDNGLPSALPTNMKGVTFVNGLTKARDFSWLKDTCGILIALSHLGVEDDLRLADSMPGLDLIIGGHSHTLLEQPLIENGVMIVQAGAHLRHVGKTTLTTAGGRVTGRTYEVIPLTSLTGENPQVKRTIAAYNDNPELKQVVGKAEQPIHGVAELGSMMTDAVTNQLKVDFAFQNRGGIRITNIPAGEITLNEVYKLDPFNNPIVLYSMTPEEIGSLICYGFRHEKGIDLQVSGMTYRVTSDTAGSCTPVEMLDLKGKPLEPGREYSVAVNSYIASTYVFDHRDPGTVSNLTTTEVLIRYLREKGIVNYSGVKRATVAR